MRYTHNDYETEIDSSQEHLDELKDTLEMIDKDRSQVSGEINAVVDEFKSRMSAAASTLSDLQARISSATSKDIKADSIKDVRRIMDLNPNSILVVEGDNGGLYTIDNRNTPPTVSLDIADSIREDSIRLFRFFRQLKPMHGRHKGESYNVDSLMEMLHRHDGWNSAIGGEGIYVEPKHNGVRVQIHKAGRKVICWTAGKKDVSGNMPSIVKSLQAIPHDFVVEGEVELFVKNKHRPRATTAGMLTSGQVNREREGNLRLTLYDLLWYDGKDLHTQPYSDRAEKLKEFDKYTFSNVKLVEQEVINSLGDLQAAVEQMGDMEGSEGAMLKLPSYTYELDGKTSRMMKYKKEMSLDVKIINRHIVDRSTSTYTYDCAVAGPGGDDVPIGTTFNTNVKSETGIIKVSFSNLNEYYDPDTGKRHFKWVFPRVVEARPDKQIPDSADAAHDIILALGKKAKQKQYPKKKALNDAVPVKYKIQKQTYTDSAVRYKTLLHLPSKMVAITTDDMPAADTEGECELQTVRASQWEVDGTISASHVANDRNMSCDIEIIDNGEAKMELISDPTVMKFYFDNAHGFTSLKATKQNAKYKGPESRLWDLTWG